jgi:hypothetical protein
VRAPGPARRAPLPLGLAAALLASACLLAPAAEAAPLPRGSRIAVLVYERNPAGTDRGLGAAESLVKGELVRAGYRLVDPARLERIRREKAALAALEGNVEAILALSKQYGVGTFVRGRATRGAVLNDLGVYTGTATLSVQVYRGDGRYLFADAVTGKEIGATAEEASQKALLAAARRMARGLLTGCPSGGGSAGLETPGLAEGTRIPVRVEGAGTLLAADRAREILASVRGVRAAHVERVEGAASLLAVVFEGTAAQLAERIAAGGALVVVGPEGTGLRLRLP